MTAANAYLYMLAGAALFCIGFHGLIVYAHLLRKILALNVVGSGVFLILVAAAYGTQRESPDPVPHALVLTGIVVAVSGTALALVLSNRVHEATGKMELPGDPGNS
jgi:multicomponent Na+:H+ antiporter subunit C